MAVHDRWHRFPRPDDMPCKCGTPKRPLYPSSKHKQGLRWEVNYRDPNKRLLHKSYAKRSDADAFNAKVSHQLNTDDYTNPEAGKVTFESYAEDWRKARTHGESTAISLEHELRLHVYSDPENRGRSRRGGPALGHHTLSGLAKRPSLVQQWIAGMSLSDATKRKIIDRVAEVFSAAVDDGLISRNPIHAKSVSRPKPETHEAVPLTLEEVDALATALRHAPGCTEECNRCGPSRYDVLPYLGAATGVRQGEMFALDVDKDLDFLRHVVYVRRQVKIIRGKLVFAPLKNDKIHSVPMSDEAAVMLAEYIRAYPPQDVTLPWIRANGEPATFRLLLSRSPGRPMHRKITNDRWKAALKRAGIPDDRYHMMHVLRHTFASLCLSAGISVRAVAEAMGDTEATVQATYSHLMPDDTDRMRKAIGRFFTRPAADIAKSAGQS